MEVVNLLFTTSKIECFGNHNQNLQILILKHAVTNHQANCRFTARIIL